MIKTVNTINNLIKGNILSNRAYLGSNRVFPIDGSIDNTFEIGTGFSAGTRSIKIQTDGKVLVVGDFTSYNSITRNRIVRLNTDGSLDNTFSIGTGLNNFVTSIEIQSDGKIIVVGEFITYNSNARNRIVRLNTDGSLDNTFSIGTGFNNIVQSTKIQTDGKLIAGGAFTNYNGTGRNGIVRLNTDGSIDNTFNIGTGFDNNVLSIEIQTDGKIIAGGFFTNYNGTGRNNLVRINTDGTVDTSFTIGTGFNSGTYSIKIQPDGKVLVGGLFTDYNGNARNRMVRLNTNGSIDNTFNIGTGFNGIINSLILQTDGKVLVVGDFTSYNSITRNRIVRLNTDGSLDNTFSIGTGLNNFTRPIEIQTDGKIIVGGSFTSYNGTGRNRIVRLYI